ncbi:carbonic anhydrase [Humibacter soli]
MSTVTSLLERNRDFATHSYDARLTMGPRLKTIVISCFDPRVDPALILGAEPGDVGVLRNVGGRVTPHTVRELIILQQIGRSVGSDLGPGWDVIVLQHTDCGITRVKDRADLLSGYFEDDPQHLSSLAVPDPRAAIRRDVALLRSDERLSGATVTGLLYDVTTGLVESVRDS